MRNLWLGILLAAVESLAFGQLDSDTLTVSASRSFNPQPDQLVFGFYIITEPGTGLDEVVAGLKSVGIAPANFSTLGSSTDNTHLTWFFNLAVPFSKVPATIALLTAQKIKYGVRDSQVSAASLQAQQCPVPILMADVKAYAKTLADAAGLAVGEVVAMSDGSSMGGIGLAQPARDPVGGRPGTTGLITTTLPPPTPIQPVSCSLTVKFKLLRLHY